MFVLVILFLSLLSPASCVNISFPVFDPGSCSDGGSLICMGSVSIANQSLIITPDPTINAFGRVLYRDPMIAWPASFETTFTIKIVNSSASVGADGMAFVLAQNSNPSPSLSFGSYMGIFDQSTEGVLRQIAIEFDTFKNEYDPDDNHIAIDTVSVEKPVAVRSLNSTGINLKSRREITVKVEYDGWSKNMQISVAHVGEPLVSFLNHTMRMKGSVPSSVYVGFTGATGTLLETHQVLSWNFTSIELPKQSLGGGKKKALLIIVIPTVLCSMFLATIVAIPFVRRALRRRKENLARKGNIEVHIASANAPKLFTYRQLSKATRNFSKENLLGTGGFGSVYKGVTKDPHATIAVKKISSTSKQGEKEYLAEICTIGRLRHKNLLQLQGWCHDRDELLLVYEYMPNGSLDNFIGNGKFLDWTTRYKILMGLASVLVYLHEECGNPVVHRDVKPNNVMLDSNFDAHLGDFGLARLLQNKAASVTSMIAGTPGYLAPEVSFTGKATAESDVYSFGMVVIEVVCGKRSNGIMEENNLVECVWKLYEKGELLDCVDEELEGKYDETQVRRSLLVGLACLHPDYTLRPRMRKVVHIFMNSDEPLMSLPASRPLSVCLLFGSSASTTPNVTYSTALYRDHIESFPDETTIHDDQL
ncbi:probable L-type lectin-domain containing receptor kinase S.5 [Actinidia eriantha]|uniref:probable L-type lectin-domain containing receptor kinase S.5 n=1 Tax=Actinidia eriantha TaxID=165200 RepID=UPI00258E1D96|nr:probable L-type lectin-domain containing receptor kinase S.5 [Actinidia eriantha]